MMPRVLVMLLDPSKIDEIKGPRWVRFGNGIEYLLPKGFLSEALVPPPPRWWPLQVT